MDTNFINFSIKNKVRAYRSAGCSCAPARARSGRHRSLSLAPAPPSWPLPPRPAPRTRWQGRCRAEALVQTPSLQTLAVARAAADRWRRAAQIDLVAGMMDCLYAQCTPCVTDCVVAELEKLGQRYRVALKVAKVGLQDPPAH